MDDVADAGSLVQQQPMEAAGQPSEDSAAAKSSTASEIGKYGEEVLRRMSVKEIQQVEFDMLRHVEEFCRSAGIRYYLVGGTLLGAVRHGGFIPWDDDVDIAMPRPDYEEFLRAYEAEPHTELRTADSHSSHFWGYAKLIDLRTHFQEPMLPSDASYGVFLDVFPLDGAASSWLCRRLECGVFGVLRRIAFHAHVYRDDVGAVDPRRACRRTVTRFARRVFSRISLRTMLSALERIVTAHIYEHSSWVGLYWGAYGHREFVPKKYFEGNERVGFQGVELPVPAEWDLYLQGLYGEYMIPRRDSGSSHGEAYWRVRS